MEEEVAKAAAQQAAKEAGGIAQRLFGPLADAVGLWMAQPLKERLAMNQLNAMMRLAEKCDKMRLPLRMLNLKTVYSYIEGAAVEEEPTLQEMWANLMANALDPDHTLDSEVYPEVLKHLSKWEAELLKKTMEKKVKTIQTEYVSPKWQLENDQPLIKEVQLANLKRLGLVENFINVSASGDTFDSLEVHAYPTSIYRLTQFGANFVTACTRS